MSNSLNSAQRLRLKQVPIDVWSTREKLALASSVARSGDQNWYSVSRPLKAFGEPNRPADWFSQKNCALQYSDLLEKVETPKRKRGERGEETAEDLIVRKLTSERIEELKSVLKIEREKWLSLKEELKQVQTGQADEELLKKISKRHEESRKIQLAKDEEHKNWLKEREAKHAAIKACRASLVGFTKTQKQNSNTTAAVPTSTPLISTPELEPVKTEQAEEKPAEPVIVSNLTSVPTTVSSSDIVTLTTTDVACNVIDVPVVKTESKPTEPVIEEVKKDKEKLSDSGANESDIPSPLLLSSLLQTSTTSSETPSKDTNKTTELKKPVAPSEPMEISPSVNESSESTNVKFDVKFSPTENLIDSKQENQSVVVTMNDTITTDIIIKKEPEIIDASKLKMPNCRFASSRNCSQITESSSSQEEESEEDKEEEQAKKESVIIKKSTDNVSTPTTELVQPLSPVKSKTQTTASVATAATTTTTATNVVSTEISIKEEVMDVKEISEDSNQTLSSPSKQDLTEEESLDSKLAKSTPNTSRSKRKRPSPVITTSARRSDRFKAVKDSKSEEDTHPKTGGKKFTLLVNEEITDASMSEESMDASVKVSTSKAPSVSESTPNSPASSTMHSDDLENLREYKLWKKSIMLIWRQAATHKYASLFANPVTDDEAKGYSTVVYRPKDLNIIRKRIENGQLRTTAEFQRDIMLMFQNAIMYNSADHEVHQMAIEMQKEILEGIEDYIETQQQSGNQSLDTSTKARGRRSGITTPIIDTLTQDSESSIASRRKSRTSTDTDPGTTTGKNKPKTKK